MAKLREMYDYIKISPDGNSGMKFMLLRDQAYWSKRYKHFIKAGSGFKYNGADWVDDLEGADGMSTGPLFHDVVCNNACWEDGSPISNWQASMILRDILSAEGHPMRKRTWFWFTLMLGGNHIKKKSGWLWARNR